jgi:hypothetical protein
VRISLQNKGSDLRPCRSKNLQTDLESKAPREAPSFPLLPFVKKIFTAPTSSGRKGNEDNEGLEQLFYRILVTNKASSPKQ